MHEFGASDPPLFGPFALVSAIVCYFGIDGIQIEIENDFPFQSGLGGSGASAVALIGAISAALDGDIPTSNRFPEIIRLAHNLEDSLFHNTGLQDQAAAAYGGANLWEWTFTDRLEYSRHPITLTPVSLNNNILLVYTGVPHEPTQEGSRMLSKFKETGSIDLLAAISEEGRKFADAVGKRDFRMAAASLNAEYELRSTLLPVQREDDLELIALAAEANCGVGVTGSGKGGCIWAIGEASDIQDLARKWSGAVANRKVGGLLPIEATDAGLEICFRRRSEALPRSSSQLQAPAFRNGSRHDLKRT